MKAGKASGDEVIRCQISQQKYTRVNWGGGRRSHQQSSQSSLPPASRLNGILNMAALTLRAAIKHLEEVPYLIPFASAALHWKQALSPAVAQKQMSVCPVKASFIHLELVRVCFNENWLLIGWFYFLPLCWRNESTTRIDYAVRFTATPTQIIDPPPSVVLETIMLFNDLEQCKLPRWILDCTLNVWKGFIFPVPSMPKMEHRRHSS